MKPYRMHIFVCQGKRCAAKGSEGVLDALKKRIKAEGIKDVRVSKSGCLKLCKETDIEGELCPALLVYPEGVWYRLVAENDLDEIIEGHVKKGAPVRRLLHFNLSDRGA
jgi:(2Fe-2S) ferredoxin